MALWVTTLCLFMVFPRVAEGWITTRRISQYERSSLSGKQQRSAMSFSVSYDDDDICVNEKGKRVNDDASCLKLSLIPLQDDDNHEDPSSPVDSLSVLNEHEQQLQLRSRLPSVSQAFSLNQTCHVRSSSTITAAGRGLFASRDLRQGEWITCYPGDAFVTNIVADNEEEQLLLEWGDHVTESWRFGTPVVASDHDDDPTGKITSFPDQEGNDPTTSRTTILSSSCTQKQTLPHQGEHDDGNDRAFSFQVYDYLLGAIQDDWAILALPYISDDDIGYLGHVANDGVTHAPTCEAELSRYVLESQEVSNAMHQPMTITGDDSCHDVMATIATRSIHQGEEIFVSYGPDFWQSTWPKTKEQASPYNDHHRRRRKSRSEDNSNNTSPESLSEYGSAARSSRGFG